MYVYTSVSKYTLLIFSKMDDYQCEFLYVKMADLMNLSVYILVHKLYRLYFVYNTNEIIFLLT